VIHFVGDMGRERDKQDAWEPPHWSKASRHNATVKLPSIRNIQ